MPSETVSKVMTFFWSSGSSTKSLKKPETVASGVVDNVMISRVIKSASTRFKYYQPLVKIAVTLDRSYVSCLILVHFELNARQIWGLTHLGYTNKWSTKKVRGNHRVVKFGQEGKPNFRNHFTVIRYGIQYVAFF